MRLAYQASVVEDPMNRNKEHYATRQSIIRAEHYWLRPLFLPSYVIAPAPFQLSSLSFRRFYPRVPVLPFVTTELFGEEIRWYFGNFCATGSY